VRSGTAHNQGAEGVALKDQKWQRSRGQDHVLHRCFLVAFSEGEHDTSPDILHVEGDEVVGRVLVERRGCAMRDACPGRMDGDGGTRLGGRECGLYTGRRY
jgi:hypothetical protein